MFIHNLLAIIGFFTVIFFFLGKYSDYKKKKQEEMDFYRKLENQEYEKRKKEEQEKKYEEEYRQMMKLTNYKNKVEDSIIEKELRSILSISIAITKKVTEDPFCKKDKVIYGVSFLNDFSVDFLYFGGMDTILKLNIREGEIKEKIVFDIINNNSYYIVCYYCKSKSNEMIYFFLKKKK